jgi:hypothetical protein
MAGDKASEKSNSPPDDNVTFTRFSKLTEALLAVPKKEIKQAEKDEKKKAST